MSVAIGILWFIGLLSSMFILFETLGWTGLIRMFPEGRRWWILPVQWTSIAYFASMVHFNPWM